MSRFKVLETHLSTILPFRRKYLKENKFQIRYNACHERNWTDSYALFVDGKFAGYGSVKGLEDIKNRNAIFEFYILESLRGSSKELFRELILESKAKYLEAQTNDLLATEMLHSFGENIEKKVQLFCGSKPTNLETDEIKFRKRIPKENVFGKKEEDIGQYVLDLNGETVADGGYMTHYNAPYADLFMDVATGHRNKGYGSYLVQELKRQCIKDRFVPSARCLLSNEASAATLKKAGMIPVGFMLKAKVNIEY